MASGDTLTIRAYGEADFELLVALWKACGLTRWYNVPERDLALWRRTASAEVLVGLGEGGKLAASVCVGHDGHRGWVYYLAVDPAARGLGHGRRMMRAAEEWLLAQDCPKMHAIVRRSNAAVKGFYESIGYSESPCDFMERWLIDRGDPPEGETPAEATPEESKLTYTITYLEMTEHPRLEPAQPPAGLRLALLRAENPSVAFYRYLYDRIGEDWTWWERRLLGDAELEAIIQNPKVEIYVLYVNGVPAGYFEIDRRNPRSVDLAYFGLLPEFVGRGLGAYFLTEAIETAWSSEPERVTVNTNSLDHPRALTLYQRLGFLPIGQKDMKIDDPRRDPRFQRRGYKPSDPQ